jgi:hypothetical protein
MSEPASVADLNAAAEKKRFIVIEGMKNDVRIKNIM